MKQKFQSLFTIFLFVLILIVTVAIMRDWAKNDVWSAGMHDSKCEGGHCHCYERLSNK